MKTQSLLRPRDKGIKKQLGGMIDLFIEMQKPSVFNPRDPSNVLRHTEEQFEEVVNTMEDQGHYDPKNLTEYSYYHKILYLQKKHRPRKGAEQYAG